MTEGPDADGTEADGIEEDAPPDDATETSRDEDSEQGMDREYASEPDQEKDREHASEPDQETDRNQETEQEQAADREQSPAGDGAVGATVAQEQPTPTDGDEREADQTDGSLTLPVFESPAEAAATVGDGESAGAGGVTEAVDSDVPADVRKYDKFKKIDGGTYDRANEFLRDRTYITAREWAIARLCADFRTETGVEMTKIGENLPELVPFMTDTYTPQAVNQARSSFEGKVRKSGATFLYGAMCDFFTAQELDDVMYEATEVAKFLLEVEGVELSVDEELEAEDRISEVMREVREHSAALRHDEMTCPECGHEMNADE